MKPIFVRSLTEAELKQLEAGLHSSDVFVMRRCQILLTSARRGEQASNIARMPACNKQTVRNKIKAFNELGFNCCLRRRSTRPHKIHAAFDSERAKNYGLASWSTKWTRYLAEKRP